MVERFLYIRDKENKNVLASVGLFVTSNDVIRTFTIKSERDQHSKSVARSILRSRAINSYFIMLRDNFQNEFHESSIKNLLKKANEKDFWKFPSPPYRKIEINPPLSIKEQEVLGINKEMTSKFRENDRKLNAVMIDGSLSHDTIDSVNNPLDDIK